MDGTCEVMLECWVGPYECVRLGPPAQLALAGWAVGSVQLLCKKLCLNPGLYKPGLQAISDSPKKTLERLELYKY